MTWKMALFYNGVSSVLCFAGMIAGLLMGTTPWFAPWVFAAAAGMFLYIALVDMVSHLTF